ncbi:DNA cytosine methyltransferase [Oenococcus oeni]|uniref:Cytosine-specific methyltransferase n=1 Tax=Oenococcus phage phiS11 TaxID=1432847 RepID=V5URQ5_9CAUD|nr:DNA cytosine methyltransferase [Oenococcus oeni]YP_009006594.1 DNA methyltransferase [Oenococcus phage phiS11]AHB80353.1 DNA-cytosine methyltransferase [Oenococcus phage phiS11]KGH52522.1 modification methylase [Oenococcus oeni S11]MDS0176479.1 DNA cytosine methyltransferase [Oenococcus oeni]OIM37085.1 DNA (cytosine-5-)-methyltransferase [Oenococcus oeni]OLQ42067.1 DNA (cytosine-5-)-methyltransferase [Oenococcus oeni]
MTRRIISLFAGVGGIDIGFSQAGNFKTVYANEFDKNAQHTFQANFNPNILDPRDIHKVQASEIPDGDVVIAGFPCQPFSIAGYRKGLEDERGSLFFEALRIIKAKQPEVVFLENVKNLVTHDHGNTFKVIREYLVHAGYYIKWKVLNAKDYGNIPQNRERIYVVGFKDKQTFDKFSFPAPIKLKTRLSDVIDFNKNVADKFYYKQGKQAFYDQLEEEMKNPDSIYQWRRQYVRENKSGVVPTLTANMGTGGHNVPLIRTKDERIRKLTPRETFNTQGYPKNYELPEDESTSALYKQAGNSVAVPVIKRIAEKIKQVLPEESKNITLPKADDKTALIYTKMAGRMEGLSYVSEYFDNENQSKEFINREKESGIELFNNDDFFRAVKKGGNHEFYTKLG